jgi:hypothetical protein
LLQQQTQAAIDFQVLFGVPSMVVDGQACLGARFIAHAALTLRAMLSFSVLFDWRDAGKLPVGIRRVQ